MRDELRALSEDNLRVKVVMPLLYGLGCGDIRDNCGSSEYGKDVLYLKRDHFLREKVWGAVILKKTDINKSGLDNIHRQVSDAINQFIDPDDPRNQIQLHEILVVTARGITAEALKYIHEQTGKNFQNIHFVNGDRLEFLINQVIAEYNQRTNTQYVFNVETFGKVCGKSFASSEVTLMVDGSEGRVINT